MELADLIRERRTIHNYEGGEPIPEDLIQEALELAMWSPNHKLTYPWRFYWVQDDTRKALSHLAVRLKEEKSDKPLSEIKKKAAADKVLNPGALIAFVQKKTDDDFQTKEDYATMACSIQNFSLYMWSKGYGSKWSTGKLTRHRETYRLLGVDEEEEEIIGFVWAGKAERIPSPCSRPSLHEVLKKV